MKEIYGVFVDFYLFFDWERMLFFFFGFGGWGVRLLGGMCG